MTLYLNGGGPASVSEATLDAFVAQVRQRGYRIGVAYLGAPDQTPQQLDSYVDPILARMPDAVIDAIELHELSGRFGESAANAGRQPVGIQLDADSGSPASLAESAQSTQPAELDQSAQIGLATRPESNAQPDHPDQPDQPAQSDQPAKQDAGEYASNAEPDAQPATNWLEQPEPLAGLIVAGGWTPGYLAALVPQRRAISRLVRGGMPYLGFAAGAMIVSKHVIAGGWRLQDRQVCSELASEGSTEFTLREGLGLIAPTIETHADSYARLGRCFAALENGLMSSAVAIDESATFVIDAISGRTSVLGAGRVAWVTRLGSDFAVRFEHGG